jgi:hypothetical protein
VLNPNLNSIWGQPDPIGHIFVPEGQPDLTQPKFWVQNWVQPKKWVGSGHTSPNESWAKFNDAHCALNCQTFWNCVHCLIQLTVYLENYRSYILSSILFIFSSLSFLVFYELLTTYFHEKIIMNFHDFSNHLQPFMFAYLLLFFRQKSKIDLFIY